MVVQKNGASNYRISSKRYIAINRKAYDTLAEEYDKRVQYTSPYEDSPESLGSLVLNYSASKSGKMLEVGPGAGQTLKCFAGYGFYTIGVELSGKMAKIAQKNSPNSKIIKKNILDVSFKEKFEVIYLGAIVHLFPKADANILLKKLSDLLTDNGVLFINTTISKRSTQGFLTKNDYKNKCLRFRKQWTEAELKDFLTSHNFIIRKRLYNHEFDRQKEWVAFICSKPHAGDGSGL